MAGIWPNSYAIPIRIFLCVLVLSLVLSISSLAVYKATQATSMNGYLSGISIFIACCSPILRVKNYNLLQSNQWLIIFCFVSCLQIIIFLSHQKTIKKLLKTVTADFERKMRDPVLQPLLFADFKNLYRLFHAFNFFIFSHLVFSASLPIVRAMHGQYVRTYPIWLPFDTSQGNDLI